MIRQMTVWIVMGALVVGLAAPVFAQGTTQTAPAAPATPAKPAAPATGAPAASTKPKVATKTTTGTVKSASADGLMLVTMGKDKKEKEWAFVLDKDTKITKAKKAIEVKDITAKDSATVVYADADGKMVAKTVTINPPKAPAPKPAG